MPSVGNYVAVGYSPRSMTVQGEGLGTPDNWGGKELLIDMGYRRMNEMASHVGEEVAWPLKTAGSLC